MRGDFQFLDLIKVLLSFTFKWIYEAKKPLRDRPNAKCSARMMLMLLVIQVTVIVRIVSFVYCMLLDRNVVNKNYGVLNTQEDWETLSSI